MPTPHRDHARSGLTEHRSINAVAESFFASLRAELVDHAHYAARYEAKLSIGDYIDNFYNVERRHSHLDYLNPIEFELRSKNQQCVA